MLKEPFDIFPQTPPTSVPLIISQCLLLPYSFCLTLDTSPVPSVCSSVLYSHLRDLREPPNFLLHLAFISLLPILTFNLLPESLGPREALSSGILCGDVKRLNIHVSDGETKRTVICVTRSEVTSDHLTSGQEAPTWQA